jgi:integrase/recombinase XerD
VSDFLTPSIESFRLHLQTTGYAPRTVKDYGSILKRFRGWLLSCRGYGSLSEIGRDDLVEYCQELTLALNRRGKPWAASSKNSQLNGLRSFFSYLVKSGNLLSNPASDISNFKGQSKLPRVPSYEEILRLLAAAELGTLEGVRNRAWMEVLYGSGLRLGELVSLDLIDLCLDEDMLHIRLGKGEKDRFVPLTPEARHAIQTYLTTCRPRLARCGEKALWVCARGGRMKYHAVGVALHRYAEKADLMVNITPHVLRHSCATHLLKNKASLRHIQTLLGHKYLSTTQIYTRVEITDLREVLRRCHPRENFHEQE